MWDNVTYLLLESDGMELKLSIVGKRIKFFRRRNDDHSHDNMDDDLTDNRKNVEDNEDHKRPTSFFP
jgi:hypothetical protein